MKLVHHSNYKQIFLVDHSDDLANHAKAIGLL